MVPDPEKSLEYFEAVAKEGEGGLTKKAKHWASDDECVARVGK